MSGTSNRKMNDNARKRSNDEYDHQFLEHLTTVSSESATSAGFSYDVKKQDDKKKHAEKKMNQTLQHVKHDLKEKVDENHIATNNTLKDGHSLSTKYLTVCLTDIIP